MFLSAPRRKMRKQGQEFAVARRQSQAREGVRSSIDQKRKMPSRSRGTALVDVQQRLNCALPSFFSGLWFLSIPKSSRHIASDDQLIHPRELAVDLFNHCRSSDEFLLRKEVIQPQVPLRLPCYDFIPVTAHSVGGCFPCGLARRLRLQATPMM